MSDSAQNDKDSQANTQSKDILAQSPVDMGGGLRADDELQVLEIRERINSESRARTHYYVKVAVSSFLCALLLVIGVPVFIIARMTGSLSYTALGVVLVGFGLILAVAVIVLLFCPPWRKRH